MLDWVLYWSKENQEEIVVWNFTSPESCNLGRCIFDITSKWNNVNFCFNLSKCYASWNQFTKPKTVKIQKYKLLSFNYIAACLKYFFRKLSIHQCPGGLDKQEPRVLWNCCYVCCLGNQSWNAEMCSFSQTHMRVFAVWEGSLLGVSSN